MKFCLNLSSLLIVFLFQALPAFAAPKIAVLSVFRIYQEYSLVQQANKEVSEAEQSFKRVLATAETELKEIEKEKGANDKAAQAKREEIQDIVDEQVEILHDRKEFYNLQINRNLQKTLAEIAKTQKLDAIIDKSYTLHSNLDITNDFLVRLEKNTKPVKH